MLQKPSLRNNYFRHFDTVSIKKMKMYFAEIWDMTKMKAKTTFYFPLAYKPIAEYHSFVLYEGHVYSLARKVAQLLFQYLF